MTEPTLACGPYFEDSGLVASLAIFLVVKPLAYYAFINACRYRVSRAIPMRRRQAALLALVRALLGVALVGGGTVFFPGLRGSEQLLIAAWVYLYLERVAVWLGVGWWGARL